MAGEEAVALGAAAQPMISMPFGLSSVFALWLLILVVCLIVLN